MIDTDRLTGLLRNLGDEPSPQRGADIVPLLANLDLYRRHPEPLFIAGMGVDLRAPALARTVLRFSQQHGAMAAVSALVALDTVETVTTVDHLALDNVTTDRVVDLGSGISVLPEQAAPSDEFARFIVQARSQLSSRSGAILRIEKSFNPFTTVKNPNAPTPFDGLEIRPGGVEADTALRAIALTGPSYPAITVSTTALQGEGLDLIKPTGQGYGFNWPSYQSISATVPISADAPLYYAKLTALNGEDRRRIDIAILRLATSLMKEAPSDAIIDLAIALEAVLSDKNTREELTYRLRLRAALFLEHILAERKAVKKLVADLYKERSKVVHGGIPDKEDRDLADKSRQLVARLLRALIDHGAIPDWPEFELSCGQTE